MQLLRQDVHKEQQLHKARADTYWRETIQMQLLQQDVLRLQHLHKTRTDAYWIETIQMQLRIFVDK